MAKKDLKDGDLKKVSGAGGGLERPAPPPVDTPDPQFGGNLMENTEQDHDADGR